MNGGDSSLIAEIAELQRLSALKAERAKAEAQHLAAVESQLLEAEETLRRSRREADEIRQNSDATLKKLLDTSPSPFSSPPQLSSYLSPVELGRNRNAPDSADVARREAELREMVAKARAQAVEEVERRDAKRIAELERQLAEYRANVQKIPALEVEVATTKGVLAGKERQLQDIIELKKLANEAERELYKTKLELAYKTRQLEDAEACKKRVEELEHVLHMKNIESESLERRLKMIEEDRQKLARVESDIAQKDMIIREKERDISTLREQAEYNKQKAARYILAVCILLLPQKMIANEIEKNKTHNTHSNLERRLELMNKTTHAVIWRRLWPD